MDCLFILSGESLALAAAEVKARHQGAAWREVGKGVLGKVDALQAKGLAFCREVHEVLVQGKQEDVKEQLDDRRTTSKAIKICTASLDATQVTGEQARKLLIPWLDHPQVDLERPEETYGLVVSSEEWFVTKKIWVNEEPFSKRANHYRPAPHPTSLPPKLARAMVNLAVPTKEVLDPFCGSGGILIEAGLLGLQVRGNDIDPAMIERAKKNCAFCDVHPVLAIQDALLVAEPAEVIVTDVPYGRNSKAQDLEKLYAAFLAHAKGLTKTLVVGFPDLVDVDALVAASGWQQQERFVWELHKSLKKIIVVLSC